jgi:hypothetical protein
MTNDPGLDGNKLDDHVFFKLHIALPGTYQIDVVPKNNKSMHITLSDHGKNTNSAGANLGDTVTLSAPLQPGDYVIDVYAHDFVAVPAPGGWVNATNATFTIKASLTNLLTP